MASRFLLIALLLFCAQLPAQEDSLEARLLEVYRGQLLPLVSDHPELLPKKEWQSLIAWMKAQRPLPLRVMQPRSFPKNIKFLHLTAKNTLEEAQYSDDGKRLLDYRGVECDARVVFDVTNQRWEIQVDNEAWSILISSNAHVPHSVLRLYFHEVLRLAWHSKVISANDNAGKISNRLISPYAHDQQRPLQTVLQPAGSLKGSRFEGSARCAAILFREDPEGVRDGLFSISEKLDQRRCSIVIFFHDQTKATIEVKHLADGTLLLSADQMEYRFLDLPDGREGSQLELSLNDKKTTVEVYSNRDVISVEDGHLFRKDLSPQITGKTYYGEMFCNSASVSGPGFIYWSVTLPLGTWRMRYICEVKLELLTSAGQRQGFELSITGDDKPRLYRGRFEKVGYNLLLYPDDPKLGTAYFWISREREGKELVTQSGEYLFENFNRRSEVFPDLESQYVAKTYPENKRGETRLKFSDGTITQLQLNKPQPGLATVNLVLEDQTKKELIAYYARAGTLLGLWFGDIPPRAYRITKDALIDGYAGELIPATK